MARRKASIDTELCANKLPPYHSPAIGRRVRLPSMVIRLTACLLVRDEHSRLWQVRRRRAAPVRPYKEGRPPEGLAFQLERLRNLATSELKTRTYRYDPISGIYLSLHAAFAAGRPPTGRCCRQRTRRPRVCLAGNGMTRMAIRRRSTAGRGLARTCDRGAVPGRAGCAVSNGWNGQCYIDD